MVEAVERDQPRLLNRSDGRPSVGSPNRAPSPNLDTNPSRPEFAEPLICRRVKPLDLRMFATGFQVGYFDQPDSFTSRSGVLGTAIASLRPFQRWRPETHIAQSKDGNLQGFVQFRHDVPDRRWILTAMGIANECQDGMRASTELLEFSIARAGSRGVKRLFARVPTESSFVEPLVAVGFEAYMSETVLRLGNADIRRSASQAGIRQQETTDTWAVHQLYHGSSPRHVQFAEAWTSHRWDVHTGLRTDKYWRSFVMEDGFQIVAWARVRRAGNVASLEFMYSPDHVSMLVPFVESVLTRVRLEADVRQVFVAARAHQAELETTLLNAGFLAIGSQDLMIKYTAAKVTANATEFVPIPATEALERVPRRVPTYLNGSAREEPT